MLTMYFCYDGGDRIIRCWPEIPRIGDTISLPELEEKGDSFKVVEVLWEGEDLEQPTLSIHLKPTDGLFQRIVKATQRPTPCDRSL